jgi:hypothetical protein
MANMMARVHAEVEESLADSFALAFLSADPPIAGTRLLEHKLNGRA